MIALLSLSPPSTFHFHIPPFTLHSSTSIIVLYFGLCSEMLHSLKPRLFSKATKLASRSLLEVVELLLRSVSECFVCCIFHHPSLHPPPTLHPPPFTVLSLSSTLLTAALSIAISQENQPNESPSSSSIDSPC
ncbi:hypothetical protein E2C01_035052 [Portunus trituberculatus]|uniref:Uncharacterized protein n=1 Tax=Portunus trituberculatus TaxID=210409 RepID=A0A5B7F257_PORTR|nr:hypothetical protein [Portunus trituberculatus]